MLQAVKTCSGKTDIAIVSRIDGICALNSWLVLQKRFRSVSRETLYDIVCMGKKQDASISSFGDPLLCDY